MRNKIWAINRKLTPEEFTDTGLRKQGTRSIKYIIINGKNYTYHPFRAVNKYSYDILEYDEFRHCWWGITLPPKDTYPPLAEAIEDPI